jgi:hypothetical protein
LPSLWYAGAALSLPISFIFKDKADKVHSGSILYEAIFSSMPFLGTTLGGKGGDSQSE